MMTVHEVHKLTGVSIRTLQYYDKIGLLKPKELTEAGYRLYDEESLEQLQRILLFRELQFPLKDIKEILESPDFDKYKALEQQIELLELKKTHIENLIALARGMKLIGVNYMNFQAFDTSKIDEYARQAKANWGKSEAYKEFEEKSKGRTKGEDEKLEKEIMILMAEFGELKDKAPDASEVQAQVKKLQDFLTANFYNCTKEILSCLGTMYAGGGDFTVNIDEVAGEGTAVFINEAIQIYCK